MNKKICFFCVGTGGHVLPVKNLVQGLINKSISNEKILIITDKRGSVYLKDLSVEVKVFEFYASNNGILGYLLNLRRIFVSVLQIYSYLKKFYQVNSRGHALKSIFSLVFIHRTYIQ